MKCERVVCMNEKRTPTTPKQIARTESWSQHRYNADFNICNLSYRDLLGPVYGLVNFVSRIEVESKTLFVLTPAPQSTTASTIYLYQKYDGI
jgi:hypothetical protein